MQIHELKPKTKNKKKKRIGRGGKRGTYSGKGMKGQKSRAGRKMAPIARELIKRYPKLRGYNFSPLKKDIVINLSIIDKVFENNEVVSFTTLVEKKIIKKSKKGNVKILGNGNLSKKVKVIGCSVSKKAEEDILKMGGEIITEKDVQEKKQKPKNTTKAKVKTKKK